MCGVWDEGGRRGGEEVKGVGEEKRERKVGKEGVKGGGSGEGRCKQGRTGEEGEGRKMRK